MSKVARRNLWIRNGGTYEYLKIALLKYAITIIIQNCKFSLWLFVPFNLKSDCCFAIFPAKYNISREPNIFHLDGKGYLRVSFTEGDEKNNLCAIKTILIPRHTEVPGRKIMKPFCSNVNALYLYFYSVNYSRKSFNILINVKYEGSPFLKIESIILFLFWRLFYKKCQKKNMSNTKILPF